MIGRGCQRKEKEVRNRREKRWENFCEQKFSPTLSKNFNWKTALDILCSAA